MDVRPRKRSIRNSFRLNRNRFLEASRFAFVKNRSNRFASHIYILPLFYGNARISFRFGVKIEILPFLPAGNFFPCADSAWSRYSCHVLESIVNFSAIRIVSQLFKTFPTPTMILPAMVLDHKSVIRNAFCSFFLLYLPLLMYKVHYVQP